MNLDNVDNEELLKELERDVDNYQLSWMTAAIAIRQIKRDKLYIRFIKDGMKHTWREYCQKRFCCTPQYMNKMIRYLNIAEPFVKKLSNRRQLNLPKYHNFWAHYIELPPEKREEVLNSLFTESDELVSDWRQKWFESYAFCKKLKLEKNMNLYKVTRVDDADIRPGTDVPISFICTAPDELTARKIIPYYSSSTDPIKDLEDARVGEVGVDGNCFYDDSVHGFEWPAELSKIRVEYLGKSNLDRMVVLMVDDSGC